MSRPRNKPKPVHLAALESIDAPACLRGRGKTTTDTDAVTCPACRQSGTMTRILMRRKRGEVDR